TLGGATCRRRRRTGLNTLCRVGWPYRFERGCSRQGTVDALETSTLKLSHNSSWLPRSAPGAQQKQFTPPCMIFDLKCSREFSSFADFGRVMVDRGKVPHQNRLPFSLPAGRQVCSFLAPVPI